VKVAAVSFGVWGVAVLSLAAAQQKKPADKPPQPAFDVHEAYRTTCQPCHGPDGNAPIKDMSFADGEWKHGSSLSAIQTTITEGVKGTPMVGFKDKFTGPQIAALAKLVRSFDKTAKKTPVKK
jgi:mono/diheme cytochrome c family protein